MTKLRKTLFITMSSMALALTSVAVALNYHGTIDDTKSKNNSDVFIQNLASDPDIHAVVDINDGSSQINTTIKRASISEGKIVIDVSDYIIWSNDLDSPIRGISSLSINIETESYPFFENKSRDTLNIFSLVFIVSYLPFVR